MDVEGLTTREFLAQRHAISLLDNQMPKAAEFMFIPLSQCGCYQRITLIKASPCMVGPYTDMQYLKNRTVLSDRAMPDAQWLAIFLSICPCFSHGYFKLRLWLPFACTASFFFTGFSLSLPVNLRFPGWLWPITKCIGALNETSAQI